VASKPEEGDTTSKLLIKNLTLGIPTPDSPVLVTPGFGQPNGDTVPVPQANLSTTPVADAQVIDPPVPTPAERKLQLHLQMTRLQSELDNL
jgi:hypothetical protein